MRKIQIKNIEVLQFPHFDEKKCLNFSTTIHGGVSTGAYSSFNLSFNSGDVIDSVRQNRELLINALGIPSENLYVPTQTHSVNIVTIDEEFVALPSSQKTGRLIGIDGLMTNIPLICVSVGSADCVPILIFDPTNKAIAVVHAGWRGTVARIAVAAIIRMQKQYGTKPEDVKVGLAPSICVEQYEIGDEVGIKFEEAKFDLSKISYRDAKTNRLHIDLWKANTSQLEEIGVKSENIEVAGLCTWNNKDDFFSARRQTIHSGRMLTGGMIKE